MGIKLEGKHVVELASGPMRNFKFFESKGVLRYTGVDTSIELVNKINNLDNRLESQFMYAANINN